MARIEEVHPVVMSSDVDRTILTLQVMGFSESFRDDPYNTRYAGMTRDGIVVHIQWNDLSALPPDMDRPTLRFLVDDVDGLATEFASAGLDDVEPFASSWGTYEFHIQDHDRNGYQFYALQ